MILRLPSLPLLFWTFLKIGSTAFGGLMSLIAVVENIVVEKMRLLSHEDILDGISLTTFLPGPISTNVVVYVGYRIRGKLGALVSLVGTILPSFCLITGLAMVYFEFGEIAWVESLFLGFIPSVVAIIVSTAWQMSLRTIKDWRQSAIAVLAAVMLIGVGGLYLTISLIIVAGGLGWWLFRPQVENDTRFPQSNFSAVWLNLIFSIALFQNYLSAYTITRQRFKSRTKLSLILCCLSLAVLISIGRMGGLGLSLTLFFIILAAGGLGWLLFPAKTDSAATFPQSNLSAVWLNLIFSIALFQNYLSAHTITRHRFKLPTILFLILCCLLLLGVILIRIGGLSLTLCSIVLAAGVGWWLLRPKTENEPQFPQSNLLIIWLNLIFSIALFQNYLSAQTITRQKFKSPTILSLLLCCLLLLGVILIRIGGLSLTLYSIVLAAGVGWWLFYPQVENDTKFPQSNLSIVWFDLIFCTALVQNYLFTHTITRQRFKSRTKLSLLFCCLPLAAFVWWLVQKSTLVYLFFTFATISLMLFGGAYVGIPLIQEIIVQDRSWLTPQQFADGIALGQITPGPIVISAAFIGYKVQGISGALAATVGIFLPPFFLTIGGTQILQWSKQSGQIQAAMQGIRPAVIGMIFAAAWIVAQTAPFNLISGSIFGLSLFVLLGWKINLIWLILAAGVTGLLFY
jgi:chromate transport protein ChrA